MHQNLAKDVMTVVWLDLVDAALGVERLVEVSVQHPACTLVLCHACSSCACHRVHTSKMHS